VKKVHTKFIEAIVLLEEQELTPSGPREIETHLTSFQTFSETNVSQLAMYVRNLGTGLYPRYSGEDDDHLTAVLVGTWFHWSDITIIQ
jgi:hypothetical protein